MAALRKRQELTQDETARRLEIALRNYQRMESGRQNLTLQTIEKVARALAVSPLEVITVPEDRPSSNLFIVPALDEEVPQAVPVFDLDVAAGYARNGRTAGALGWTLLTRPERLRRAFVAQVTGRSMEPLIPSGSWCLFSAADGAAHDGQIGLFEVGERGGPDDGGRYVVKRLRIDRGTWTLHSVNRTFSPIALGPEDEVRVVAVWVGVVSVQ